MDLRVFILGVSQFWFTPLSEQILPKLEIHLWIGYVAFDVFSNVV